MKLQIGIVSTILLILPLTTFANIPDKTKCPDTKQIQFKNGQQAWSYIFYAHNNEQKYFISKEYVEDDHNGPPFPEILIDAHYNSKTKEFSCVYLTFAREENSRPTLVNYGDY